VLQRGDLSLKKAEFWITLDFDPDQINQERMACKLADALTWVEGVGTVEIKVIDEGTSNPDAE
jgi:hypothetical protein